MLPVEKEMIGLLLNGASTPLENIQVSFFLVAWPSLLMAVLRMVRNEEKETQGFIRAGGYKELAQEFAKRNGAKTEDRLPARRRFKHK